MFPKPISFFAASSGGINPDALVTKWNVVSDGDSIEIKHSNTHSASINYDIDWGDGQTESGITTQTKTHTYATAGQYIVQITGSFVAPNFGGSAAANRDLLLEMIQWGTLQYKYLYRTFYECGNMIYSATDAPDLTNVDTNQSGLFREMFVNCNSITALDLSHWTLPYDNTAKSYMTYRTFYGLSNCENLNISGWDVRDATNSYDTFRLIGGSTTNGCDFEVDNLNFSRNNNIQSMFHTSFVNSLNLDNWTLNSSGTTNMSNFFQNTKWNVATDVDFSTWSNTSAVTNMTNFGRYQTGGISLLQSVDFTGWDTSNITTLNFWFYGAKSLTEIKGLNGLSGNSVTTMKDAFYDCKVLSFTNHNFGSNWDSNFAPTSATALQNTFYRVGQSLSPGGNAPNVSNWDISNCTILTNCFNDTRFNTALNLSNWDFSSCTSLNSFLKYHQGTTSLTFNNISSSMTTIYAFGWLSSIVDVTFSATCDLSGVQDWRYFMYQNPSFTTLNLDAAASFAGTIANRMTGIFGGNVSTAPTLDVASYDMFLRRVDATIVNLQTIQANNSQYTCGGAAETARNNLIAAGHTITDAGCV